MNHEINLMTSFVGIQCLKDNVVVVFQGKCPKEAGVLKMGEGGGNDKQNQGTIR